MIAQSSEAVSARDPRAISAVAIPSASAIAEFATIAFLFSTCLVFVRPQLEGWVVLNQFKTHGFIESLAISRLSSPTRWLEQLPLGLAWELGHGGYWAVGAIYGAELIGKYLILRWAVSPVLSNRTSIWLAAVIAAVMPPWTDEWRAHNEAQQLSALFLLVSLGASIRLTVSSRPSWFGLSAVGVFLSLITYEGLALGALAIPIASALLTRGPARQSAAAALRSSVPIVLALSLYAVVLFAVQDLSANISYHARLLHSPRFVFHDQHFFDELCQRVLQLYESIYIEPMWSTGLLIVTLGYLTGSRIQYVCATAVAVMLLPLLSLPYVMSTVWLYDLERTTFPVGFGFLLLVVVLLARSQNAVSPAGLRAIGAAMLIVAGFMAYGDYRPYQLQRSVLNQVVEILKTEGIANPIQVQDWSGLLGDRYTFFYPDFFRAALQYSGFQVAADLCTPDGVERIHPRRWHSGEATRIPRCEGEHIEHGTVILDVKPVSGQLVVSRR